MAALHIEATGDSIPYTPNGADLVAGEVVPLATMIGISPVPVVDGQVGELAVSGRIDKAPVPSALVVAAGDALYWDVADQEFNKTASGNILAGKAYNASPDGATVVGLLLNA